MAKPRPAHAELDPAYLAELRARAADRAEQARERRLYHLVGWLLALLFIYLIGNGVFDDVSRARNL